MAFLLAAGLLLSARVAPAQAVTRTPAQIFGIGLVYAAAWSADGSRVAIGANNFVAVYKVSTGEKLLTILDRNTWGSALSEPRIRSLAFSRDGKLLATGNNRSEARIWDAATGALKRTLTVGASGKINGLVQVDFTYDSKYLLTALGYWTFGEPLDTGVLKLWDSATGTPLRTFATTDYFTGIAASPTRAEFATCNATGSVRLWRTTQNASVRTYEGLYNVTAMDVAFSRDGNRLAVALASTSWGDTEAAILWNTNAAAPVHTYIDNTDKVYSVAFTASGQLVTGGLNKAKRWSASSGFALQKSYASDNGYAQVLALSPDASSAQLLVAGNHSEYNGGGEVKIFNTATAAKIRTIKGHDRGVKSLALTPDGTRLLTGSESNVSALESAQARMYDLASGRELFALANTSGDALVGITPDGKTLMTATFGNGLKVWNASGGLIREVKDGGDQVFSSCAAFAAGGARILSGISSWNGSVSRYEGVVQIFDWARGLKEREIAPIESEVSAVNAYHGITGDFLSAASGAFGGKTYLYSLTGAAIPTPIPYPNWVYSTALSPSGRWLALGGPDGVWLWDLKQGKRLFNFPSNGNAVAFSPDGRYLAAGDGWKADNYGDNGYGRVQVWNTASGTLIRTFQCQKQTVKALAYTPDGTRLLSGSLDGTVALWSGLPARNGAAPAWAGYE